MDADPIRDEARKLALEHLRQLRARQPANDNWGLVANDPLNSNDVSGWRRGIEAALMLLGVKPEDY